MCDNRKTITCNPNSRLKGFWAWSIQPKFRSWGLKISWCQWIMTGLNSLVKVHKSCNDKCFPPFCTWKLQNSEVLGLRMDLNGQIEWSIISIGLVQPRKVVHLKRWTGMVRWTEPIYSVLNRNYWKFCLNRLRPLEAICVEISKASTWALGQICEGKDLHQFYYD